ncbi:hypothetical protein HN011_011097 [Eciton burchellii]|nr:hypothetical protein HN011_011097 [Eciton burchellii]
MSVQRPIIIPLSSVIQLRSIPHMPYIAHKRLITIIHTPIHHVYHAGAMVPIRVRARVRPSILAAEFNRIRDLPRPTTRSYIEEYLNSRNNILFDDEAREIRARVDSLLRRVHVFVPRAVASDFIEEIVPERMRSHDYVRRLLSGRNNAKKDVEYLSWYEVPDRGSFGTLACVKYVAGKPQSVRKPYFKIADLRPIDIRNDVNFLSYYSKNRQAAATASSSRPMTEREIRKAYTLGINSTCEQEKIKSETKSEEKLEKTQPEKESLEESERIPEELIKQSILELIPESAKPSKSAESINSAESTKFVKEIEAETKSALEVELMKESESVSMQEFIQESIQESGSVPETEPIIAQESKMELEIPKVSVAQNIVADESIEANVVSDKMKDENLQEVKQEKQDAIKRAEEYLAKAAQEAQSEEERRKAAEEERLQLEVEERKAWEALQLAQERKAELNQILETERKEAERKAEEMKEQAEREEMEKREESERLINQAKLTALIQEQERLIVEEHLEEIQQQKQEQEAIDIIKLSTDEHKDFSCAEDLADQSDITDQEKEEKLYDIVTDDETRIEEENAPEEEHIEITEEAFIEEPTRAENKQMGSMAIEIESQMENITSGEEFEWGDQDM